MVLFRFDILPSLLLVPTPPPLLDAVSDDLPRDMSGKELPMISIIVIVIVTAMPNKLSRFDKIVHVVTIDLIMVTYRRVSNNLILIR